MNARTLARTTLLLSTSVVLALAATPAFAWGDVGHMVVANIAEHFLEPAARQKAFALLATDTSTLTAHDLVSEATWADRFRDSDRFGTQVHYLGTRNWHFVDIEIAGVGSGDIDAACFGHPVVPAGTVDSMGPAANCNVDKIVQFANELASPSTPKAERLLALKFLLHFVGDVHQPLHASDDHDSGGNTKAVHATGLGTGSLHGFWDTQFVKALGPDATTIATTLIAHITPMQQTAWSAGKPSDWAEESFALSKADIYAKLPKPQADKSYLLSPTSVKASEKIVASQLSKAGVRLAAVLNEALAP